LKTFEAQTLDEVYPLLCKEVAKEDFELSPRGIATRDVGHVALTIHDPRQRILTNRIRKINPYFLVAEFLWIVTRQQNVDLVGFYNKKMYDFSDDGRNLFGAYGPRIMFQLPTLVQKIRMDPNTRQAVATIFKPRDQQQITKDFPCNIMLHFIPRKGVLNLLAYVRSQDVLLGLPYDFYHWSALQEMMATELGMDVGTYTHICGSLHGYERDLDIIEKISNSTPEDTILVEEAPTGGLFDEIRTVSNLEYQIRKKFDGSKETFEIIRNDIHKTEASALIKEHLLMLLYYRVRRVAEPDSLPSLRDELVPTYDGLLKHISWI